MPDDKVPWTRMPEGWKMFAKEEKSYRSGHGLAQSFIDTHTFESEGGAYHGNIGLKTNYC